MLIAARSRRVQRSAGRSAPCQTAKAIVSAGTRVQLRLDVERRRLDLADRERRQEIGRDVALPRDDPVRRIHHEPLAVHVHEVHEHEVARQVGRRVALPGARSRRGRRAPSRSGGVRRRSRSSARPSPPGPPRWPRRRSPARSDGRFRRRRSSPSPAPRTRAAEAPPAARPRDRRRGRRPVRDWRAPPASARAGPRASRACVRSCGRTRPSLVGREPDGREEARPLPLARRPERRRSACATRSRAPCRAGARPRGASPRGAWRTGSARRAGPGGRSSGGSGGGRRRDPPARSRRTEGRRHRRARRTPGCSAAPAAARARCAWPESMPSGPV